MVSKNHIYKHLDWTLIICYVLLVIFGWINIYASVYNPEIQNMFSLSMRSGSQLIWIGITFFIAIFIIFIIPPRLYLGLAWWWYLLIALLLVAVILFGKEVNGSKSWIEIGPIGFQPSELSKVTTSLVLAMTMSKYDFKITRFKDFILTCSIIIFPALLIAFQPDIGTVMVYCGFIFVMYREGLTGWVILYVLLAALLFILTLKFSPYVALLVLISILGIIKGLFTKKIVSNTISTIFAVTLLSFLPRLLNIEFISKYNPFIGNDYFWLLIIIAPFALYLLYEGIKKRRKYLISLFFTLIASVIIISSTNYIFNNILKDHHRDRIENILGISEDLKGAGYNVNQSKIAIGSGGFIGKGFLKGTQTKFDFVPEQSTDFIFCTVGEEWGLVGSVGVLILFFIIISRLIILSDKNPDPIVRIFGYCTASCIFMHVALNISMTIGLFPVVGIPLPYISYGGTSFIAFTILLFIFVRLDLEKWR